MGDEIITNISLYYAARANHKACVTEWKRGEDPLRYIPMNSFFYDILARTDADQKQLGRIMSNKNLDRANILSSEHICISYNVSKDHWILIVIPPD